MKKPDFSKKIIKILSERPAISLPELVSKFEPKASPKATYALTRAMKNLDSAGLIEQLSSGREQYARLTKAGKTKATSLKLEHESTVLNLAWDGKWRVVLLDLPESRKSERESLRYLLKKAGFVCLKNSAWISPYPFEHLFGNIKKDLGLTTELMIFVSEIIDEETQKELFKIFGK